MRNLDDIFDNAAALNAYNRQQHMQSQIYGENLQHNVMMQNPANLNPMINIPNQALNNSIYDN